MRPFIPETPEEVTAAWITDSLAGAGVTEGQRVSHLEQTVLGEGEGFLGDILRLSLTWEGPIDPALPDTMIAKLPKLANREMGELLGAYERENLFYMTLARDLPIATPAMYYGEFDRDETSEKQEEILRATDKLPLWMTGMTTGVARWIVRRKARRYVLLLEDVQAEPGDQLTGVDGERAASVLDTIARAHAAFWATPMAEHFWLLPLDIDARMRHGMFRRSRPAFAAMFPDLLEAGLDRYVARIAESGHAPMRTLCEAPTTLLHCDMRLDNVFFRGDEVVVFDWQLVRRGPAAYDVAYFLSGALREDEPAETIDALLAGYHSSLRHAGVERYALEDLHRDYALALITVLQALSTVDSMDMGEGRGKALMHGWIARLLSRLEHASRWL